MKGVIRFPKMIFQGICYEKRLIKVDKKVLILVYVRACVRACVRVCGGDFSGKRFNISTKNKLKSGVFNDKKSLQTRMLRSVVTKNSNRNFN